MKADLFLTVGVLLLFPTIPMIFNGLKEGTAPKFAFFMVLVSFGCIVSAFVIKPQGYTVNEIPTIVIDTLKSVF